MKKNNLEQLYQAHRPEAIRLRLAKTTQSQNVSDAVLGGIDGCITTFAVVSGAVGANLPAAVAIVLGFAKSGFWHYLRQQGQKIKSGSGLMDS
ncbi:MAG: hypothetical protein ABL868_02290 [Sulfuriferula sp.]